MVNEPVRVTVWQDRPGGDRVVPGADHAPHQDRPEVVNRLLGGFREDAVRLPSPHPRAEGAR